ncbi:MAG TPA: helix-turn-helix domain-containing protein [Candidatus Acidoferrum sp.]
MSTQYPTQPNETSRRKAHPWTAPFSASRIRATESDNRTPARRSGQRERVLRILQDAGERGVTNLELTFTHRVSQSASRVFELREEGWSIDSVPSGNRDGSVTYILRGRIDAAGPDNPAKKQGDFFARRATGLPLFDLAVNE